MTKPLLHKHHIIPRHAGGTDDPSNLVYLTVEQHAEAHRVLWETYGRIQDWRAWNGLSRQIGREEILKQIYSENGKRAGVSNKGRTPHNKGIPMSEEQKQKLRRPKSEEHKAALRKPKADSSKMGRHEKTDHIKQKLSASVKKYFDSMTPEQKAERFKKKRRKCIYCGMESTAGNVTRHERRMACLPVSK